MNKTLGIVLHTMKYSDTSVITRIFTRNFGLKSFIIKGVRTKKSKKLGLLQPFTILELDVKFTQKSDLGWVKELNLSETTYELSTNVLKSSLVFFCAELLYHTIEQDYQNEELFDGVHDAILKLDRGDNIANFHIWFMLEVSRYYGFYPQKMKNQDQKYFNIINGGFESLINNHDHVLGEITSLNLQLFLGTIFDNSMSIRLSADERSNLLDSLIAYFHVHIDGMKKLKSQEILNTIFS